MEKAVLISINPHPSALIANFKKKIEVRKTKPKLDTSFPVYIYCTLSGSDTFFKEACKSDIAEWNKSKMAFKKGKVIGEFVCDKIDYWQHHWSPDVMHIEKMSELSCVSTTELLDYLDGIYDNQGNNKRLYAWHISDLIIYDKPKELSEFSKYGFGHPVPLKRPPQSWCYVEVMK